MKLNLLSFFYRKFVFIGLLFFSIIGLQIFFSIKSKPKVIISHADEISDFRTKISELKTKILTPKYTDVEQIIDLVLAEDATKLTENTWVQTIYYYIVGYNNLLYANLISGKTLLTEDEQKLLLDRIGKASDALVSLELSQNKLFLSYRNKFKKYFPSQSKNIRGWSYFNRNYYPKWPKYTPKKAGSNGHFLDADHNNPPFSAYAVETGLALIALSQTANTYTNYGYLPEKVTLWTKTATEVMDYWNNNLYKKHDYGYIGWCFSEFCKTIKINGIQHNDDVYILNSNSLMAQASLNLYTLTDNLNYLERVKTVSQQLEKLMTSYGSDYGWSYGKDNKWWTKKRKKPVFDHPEDTSHAGWDLHVFGEPILYTATLKTQPWIAKNTLDYFINTLYKNVFRETSGTTVYKEITKDSKEVYSEENYRLLGDWIILAPVMCKMESWYSQDDLLKFITSLETAMNISRKYGYTYNHQFFNGVLLQTYLCLLNRNQ